MWRRIYQASVGLVRDFPLHPLGDSWSNWNKGGYVKRTMFNPAFADLPTLILGMDARQGVSSKMRGRLCTVLGES